jgi:bifunctional non-homologous end joining protein LigD
VDEVREGVELTNLDAALFEGARATKRDLVDYLDAISDRLVPVLARRPLSVVRATRGTDAFMQKNLPKHAPDWIRRAPIWAEASRREVTYALCDDRRTLLWFANQRAVEYHPALVTADDLGRITHLVLDLDPPEGAAFDVVVEVAHAVRRVLESVGLDGAVKTSGAKGAHVFVPLDGSSPPDDVAAAARALAARTVVEVPALATTAFVKDERRGRLFVDSTRVGGATVVAAYSPRLRPGTPVSYPVGWDGLDDVVPGEITVRNAVERLDGRDRWAEQMPAPFALPADVVAEGHGIPVARVQAMHEGKRRARARATGDAGEA